MPTSSGLAEVKFDILVVTADEAGAALRGMLPPLPAGSPPVLIAGLTPAALAGAGGAAAQMIESGVRLERGGVYLLPPHTALSLAPDDRWSASPLASPSAPLDGLLSALASRFGEGVLVAVLDGPGGDALAGIQAVRAAGGTVLVQRPAHCAAGRLAQRVIGAGEADLVVTPRLLGRTLGDLLGHAARHSGHDDPLQAVLDSSPEHVLLQAVRDASGSIVGFERRPSGAGIDEPQGGRLTPDPAAHGTGLFEKCVRVTESGLPSEHEQWDGAELPGRWLRWTLVKVQGGVLLSRRDVTAQRQAEQLSRASEEKYRTLFDCIDEGFCIIEVLFDGQGQACDYRYLEMNPAFVKHSGLRAGLGRTVRELVPQHEAFWFEVYGQVATTGQPRRFEHGEATLGRHFDVYAFRIGEPEQRRVAVLFNDITGRRRAEAQLRESESLHRALFDSLDEGAALFERLPPRPDGQRDYRYVALNPAMQAMFGVPDLSGRSIRDSFPDEAESWYDDYDRVLDTGQPMRFERESLPQGKVLDMFVARVEDGSGRRLLAVMRDVTERRRAGAALRESEERLRLLTLASSEMVYRMNADWSEMLSLTGKSVLADTARPSGRWLEGYIPPSEQARVQAAIDRARRSKTTFELEHRVIHADGTVGWTSSRAIPLLDPHGEIVEWFGAASDITERKHAEAALLESEGRLRALIEHLPGSAVFVVNHELRYVLAQGEALATAGLKPGALVGRTVAQVVPPAQVAQYEAHYRQVLAGREFEYEHSAHGRSFITHGVPLSDAAGSVYAALAVSYDITARKEAETALRERDERQHFQLRLSDALEALEDPVAIQDAVTRATMNHFRADRCYYCEIKGNRAVIRRDAARKGLPSVVGTYPLGDFALFRALVEQGRPLIVSDVRTSDALDEALRQLCLDLQVISFIDVPVVKQDAVVGMLCLVQSEPRAWTELEVELACDTAERTWAAVERSGAQRALRASEERFRAVANLVPDFLWESDPDGFTHWYSDRWLAYTGQTFEQATGWGWLDAIHPDDREGSARRYREAVRSGQPLGQEHRIRRTDGEYRWFAVNAAPLRDEGGEVVRMYGAATDIHDLRQMNSLLEERVDERTRRLADLNAELGSLITRIAHNLEAPAELLGRLLDPGRPPAVPGEGGLPPLDPAVLADEVRRLRGVAQDLRELSRLERDELKLELLPLGELLQEVQAQAAGQVEWLIQALPIVRGDRALLRQALALLLTFILSGTRGTRYVTVQGQEVEGEIHLIVEDDGAGLTPEEASTLFDLAVRSDQPVPLLPGSGLAQVRRILARHGGWAWAESRLSGGKVVLAFPRDEEVGALERLLGGE